MKWFNFKERQRKKIRRKSWPAEWSKALTLHFSAFYRLRSPLQEQLRQIIKILADEKNFEGCAELELTDEIRIPILAQAGLLLMGNISEFYPHLKSILVYPNTYVAPVRRRDSASLIVSEGYEARSGESWSTGSIVLAWDAVVQGASHFGNGRNVVIHEFAHHLDYEYSGSGRLGAQYLNGNLPEWIHLMNKDYQRFMRRLKMGEITLLDRYGAQSPAEFFAVATENFIERPAKLEKEYPALYSALKTYYNINPIDWYKEDN